MPPADWWKKAVIYEFYVDKFAGNFSGLIANLDYFTWLGVNCLWVLPHYPTPGIDDGYDISDYRGVRSDLGTMADFDRFLTEAHNRNLKVIVDMVLNHTSDQHAWFKEARSSKNNPKRNWFLWDDGQNRFPDAYIHFSEIKKSNWIYNEPTGDYYYATFYPQQPDLNWANPEVVAAMYGEMDYWLDKGVDGFRLDAIARLVKRDHTNCFALPEVHTILQNLRSHIDTNYPGKVLLAESGGWPSEALPFFADGNECHLVMHFPMAANLLSSIKNHNLDSVHDLWTWSGRVPDNCRWALFLTNHDSVDLFFINDENKRRVLRETADPNNLFSVPNSQSFSARLGEICQGNGDDIVWATRELFSLPGVPIIYYGNEIGMRNLVLPEKPADSRAFVRGKFDWSEVESQKQSADSVLNRTRDLIRTRTSQI